VYHTDTSLITIVSAYSDRGVMKCGIKKPTEVIIKVGLNILVLPSDCVCTTNELVIYSVSKTTSDGVVPLIVNGSIVKSVEKLTEDIAVFHGLNFSEVEQDISRFFNSVQTRSIDVANVQKSIADFCRIESLKEYHPLKIDFEDPYNMYPGSCHNHRLRLSVVIVL
jgi:hypothetical protein